MSATSLTSARDGALDTASHDTGQSHSFAFGSSKILHRHQERLAIVYVRQSDPQQVLQHRESKELQYNYFRLGKSQGISSFIGKTAPLSPPVTDLLSLAE